MSEATIRQIHPSGEHSPAWVLWHMARIEDATMNILVAGTEQVFKHGEVAFVGRKSQTINALK